MAGVGSDGDEEGKVDGARLGGDGCVDFREGGRW